MRSGFGAEAEVKARRTQAASSKFVHSRQRSVANGGDKIFQSSKIFQDWTLAIRLI
jgi:hypothetical protein